MNPVFRRMLGHYLKDQREELNLTLEGVALLGGLSVDSLKCAEEGVGCLSSDQFRRIIPILELNEVKMHRILGYSSQWYVDYLFAPKSNLPDFPLENEPESPL